MTNTIRKRYLGPATIDAILRDKHKPHLVSLANNHNVTVRVLKEVWRAEPLWKRRSQLLASGAVHLGTAIDVGIEDVEGGEPLGTMGQAIVYLLEWKAESRWYLGFQESASGAFDPLSVRNPNVTRRFKDHYTVKIVDTMPSLLAARREWYRYVKDYGLAESSAYLNSNYDIMTHQRMINRLSRPEAECQTPLDSGI